MANGGSAQPAGRSRLRRTGLVVAASLAALVSAAAVVGIGTYVWAGTKIHRLGDEPSSGASGSPRPPSYTGKCAQKSCNYLLLGSDSRAGLSKQELEHFGTNADIGGSNRSDTIILVHTEPDQGKAVFLSFPRDLWVDIPGVGENKINAAFEGGVQHGGAQTVARTVTQLTGISVDHILYVDLAGFQGLVDALGGVDMCVPYPMQDELTGLDIQAGCQHFNGYTALAYVRTRHQPCDQIPDFARISRQQQFLRAVIAKLLRPAELLRLPTLIPELLSHLVVDQGLNVAELAYLVGQLKTVGTDAAEFRAVPTIPDGIYVNGQYLSIVRPIEPAADQLFRRLRTNLPLGNLGLQLADTAPSPANISVAVYDRGSNGTADQVARTLTDGGFDIQGGPRDGSTISWPVKGPLILYAKGQEAMAKVVQSYFSNLDIEPAPQGFLDPGVHVDVVVTGSYHVPTPGTSQPPSCP
jgi:LCP family protein required for cell wall assembly